MKKILSSIAIVGLLAFSAPAQTNTPAGTIFNSVESYFTSFNTNYSFDNVKLEIDTGYAQVTGVNAASKLNAQYDLSNGLNFGVSLQFSGVGSAVNCEEAQIGYAVIQHYDTKVDAVLRAGYDDTARGAVIEPGITLKKKLTENTFGVLGISFPVYTSGTFTRTPTIYTGVGFTY